MTRSSAPLDDYARRLMAGLQTIPVEELIQCARDTLKGTRRVCMSKGDPAGEGGTGLLDAAEGAPVHH